MILLIDNYDSFTYNLAQYVQMLGHECLVIRNDKISVEKITALGPTHLVISPGPGRPDDAGISPRAIRSLAGIVPILGVCLGHQAIATVFGGSVIPGRRPVHGKVSPVHHDGRGLFAGVAGPFRAARYHSLVVDETVLPEELEVTARTADGTVMGIRHRTLALEGLQFHPESIATTEGMTMLANFVQMTATTRECNA